MNVPTVSVVVIFFNGERFLAEAIDSVFAQTFDDWELILVDDGSTDRSGTIARSYVERDPRRVRYVTHPGGANRGISPSRNEGARHATGRYLAMLDGDDAWTPEKLAEQVAIAERHPEVGMVVGAARYWYSWDPDADGRDRVRPVGSAQDVVHPPPRLAFDLYPLGPGVTPCPSVMLITREAWDRLDGFWDGAPSLVEDMAFLFRAHLEIPIYVSSACWLWYRRHDEAVTMLSGRSDYRAHRRVMFDFFGRHLDRHPQLDTPQLREATHRASWAERHPLLADARHLVGTQHARLRRRIRSLREEG